MESTLQDNLEQVKELIKDRDISDYVNNYVDLKPKGSTLQGLCPFHNEKTPSFYVQNNKGTFHCFGCGEHGDVIQFASKLHNLGFVDALKDVAKVLGIKAQNIDSKPIKYEKKTYIDNGKPIDTSILERAKQGQNTNLEKYLDSFLGTSTRAIFEMYHVGKLENLKSFNPTNYVFSSNHFSGASVFPYYSIENESVPYAKIMSYCPKTGRRNKWINKEGHPQSAIQSVHKVLELGEKPTTTVAFGWHLLNQYPEANVCILEAEKGAIGLQSFLNPCEFICISCKAEKQILLRLKELNRNVILIGDTGTEWNTVASEHGFHFFDIDPKKTKPKNYDIWDVVTDCKDLERVKSAIVAKLREFVQSELFLDIWSEPEKITESKTITGEKSEYLSDTLTRQGIAIDFSLCQNMQLVANTGTGKGRIIEMLCNLGKPVIILSPFEALTTQTAQRIEKYTHKKCIAFCGNDKEDFAFNSNNKIWCSTFASFPNLSKRIIHEHGLADFAQYHVIIDEFHYFTTAANPSFMLRQLRDCIFYLENCAGFVGMTGTPVPNAHPLFAEIPTLKVETPMFRQPLKIVISKDPVCAAVEITKSNPLKITNIVNQSKGEQLEYAKKLLEKFGYSDDQIKEFNANTKGSEHFQSVINDGYISEKIKVLLSTPVLKEGIDIKNNVGLDTHFIGKYTSFDIKQASNRFRKAISGEKAAVYIHLKQFDPEKRLDKKPTCKPFDFQTAIKWRVKYAQLQADELNSGDLYDYDILKTADVPLVFRNEDGIFQIDYLKISNVVNEMYQNWMYHCEAAFKQAVESQGFEYLGIIEYDAKTYLENHTSEKVSKVDIFNKICQELTENASNTDKILEKCVKSNDETVRIIGKGFKRVTTYYENTKDMVTDAQDTVKSVKPSSFELLRNRCVISSLKNDSKFLESQKNLSMYAKDVLKMDTSKIYTSNELKEVFIEIASKYAIFKQIVYEVSKMERITKVIKKLEPFFEIQERKQRDKENKDVWNQTYTLSPIQLNVRQKGGAISDLEAALGCGETA